MSDPKDICECGDYRDQHEPNDGACKLNSLGHGYPGGRCEGFRLFEAAPAETDVAAQEGAE